MSLALRNNGNSNYSLARDLFGWDPFFGGRQASAFAPTFEVKETNDAFMIKADIPGVVDNNLDINLHNGVLTVSGHRDAEERHEGETYALYERQYGSFTRSFSLPDVADGDRIDAKLADGVLTLSIPKRAEAKPKKIALKR
jgi:HSP20 family protein